MIAVARPVRISMVRNPGFLLASVLLASCLTMLFPLPGHAASTLTITADGEGAFQLKGVGIESASAFDIVITYDAAALGRPRVAAGPLIAGAMTAFNTEIPGTVRIAIIRITPVSGSGVIAVLSFDGRGAGPAAITSLTAKLSDEKGKPLATEVQFKKPATKTKPAKTGKAGKAADNRKQ